MTSRKAHRRLQHLESHVMGRAAWLRAAVLGADDAIVSTASLMIGVAAAESSKESILVAGIAGLVGGAMSMGAGEYVSVSSQRDAEDADIKKETAELKDDPSAELHELAGIYAKRGVDRALAMQVAEQLMAKDPLEAHLRDELGIDETSRARPLQAAWISILSFATFATIPILALLVAPAAYRMPVIALVALVSLAVLGGLGGRLGGAPVGKAALRVTVGGSLAMAATAGIGALFHIAVP